MASMRRPYKCAVGGCEEWATVLVTPQVLTPFTANATTTAKRVFPKPYCREHDPTRRP